MLVQVMFLNIYYISVSFGYFSENKYEIVAGLYLYQKISKIIFQHPKQMF